MSQIPGFSLGQMGSSPNQQPQQNMPPNMIFSQQHLLPQHQPQRATQASPSQSQGVPGVSDPEHRRMWHNPGDPAQTNFTQMAQYFRNPNLHPQQGNLQGFPQQIQPPNANANQSHHLMNSNTNQAFNTMVAQLNPSQLNALDPAAFRQFVQQQHQLRQQHAQQSQNAGNMTASYAELGFPPTTSHPVNSNAPATLTPDIARQYDILSRASQNQGQNGNSMGLNTGNPLTRPGQAQAMGQQGLSFQQTPNAQVPHQSVVSHQNPVTMAAATAQQIHMNRQMYLSGNSVDPNISGAAGSNAGGNVLNNPLAPRAPMSNAMQSAASANVTAMNTHRRLEVQLGALQQELSKHEKLLTDMGWRPGMVMTTDQQRQLVAEYEQKKNAYLQCRSIAAQMPSQVNMHVNGSNGQSTPSNHLVHGWQPGQSNKQPNAPPNVNFQQVTQRNGGPPSQSFPQQTTAQQQSQAMFTPMQQQSSLSVPRTASAQSMHNVMQQVQQQQQIPPTASVPGSMFDMQQGQSANGQAVRPPTVPPQTGAVNASQTNPPPIRTPMQVPQNTQSVPSNVPPRPSPGRNNANSGKNEFDSNLKNILERHGVTVDSNDLFIDTREVQLHELFTEVMRRGASAAVSQNDLWSIIGANLGFVQFPGTGSEPARSSAAIAEHLKYLYGKYLLAYEQLHLNQLNQERRRQLSQQQQLVAQQQQAAQRHSNGVFPFIQNPAMGMHTRDHQSAEAQGQQQQAVQNVAPQPVMQSSFHTAQPGQVQPHLNMRVTAYSQLAHMSVEELRKLGIPENNIAIIEQHRPALQRQHMLSQLQQRGPPQPQPQQGQISQMNYTIPQMQNIRGQAGGAGDGSQMHPGNVMQLSQQLQHNSQGQTTHQQMPAQAPNIPQVYNRPTVAQMNSAREFIRRTSVEQTTKLKRSYQPQIMRDVERSAYIHSFKPLFESVVEMEKKLVMFHALFQDVLSTQKLITIILTVKEQNRLLMTGSNHFILPLSAVTRLMTELRMLVDRLQQALVKLPPQAPVPASDIPSSNPPSNPPQNPPPPALINQTPVVHPQAPSETSSLQHTQVPQAVQNATQLQAQADVARAQHPQQNLQVPAQTQPISKSKRPHAGGVANTPSPAAPTTPFTNAPTPPASSSPRTPKSPPKKPSQPNPNTNTIVPATNTAPAAGPKTKSTLMGRRSSKVGQTPAVVLPATSVVEETKAGVKRSREEDSSAGARLISQPEPVAKKIKTEDWDGSMSEEIEKRQQEMNNLATNQDAQNFLARAADDILASAVGETSTANAGEDISKALQDLLSSAPSFGITDSFHMPVFDPTKFGDLSPNAENVVDNFLDSLFDFSKCATEDPIPSSSKLEPPELLHTNLSPESAAETPKHENASINGKHRDNAIKIVDDSVTHNPLERSLWTELNNGEPAFYEHPNFKFDRELPAQGSPWAISGGA